MEGTARHMTEWIFGVITLFTQLIEALAGFGATAVGLPHAQFPLDYERLVLKRVLLRGSKGHNFDEFKTVINAMASGRISVKKYISRRIKLEEVQAGFEAMKAARGLDTKVIIETQ